MRKFMRAIGNIFIAIYRIIDKLIVTPISKLVYNFNTIIKGSNFSLEKVLNKQQVLVYVSLILAVAVFLLVDSKVISLVETEAEIINDQKVNVIYNEEAYVVEGIPSTVDITLIGRKSDLYLAKQLADHEVVLDLSKEGLGEHKVKLSYKQTIESLNYKLDPSSVLVVIKEKVSELKTITYDLLNQDKLDSKLSAGDIKLDKNEIVIKGSKDALEKVANVKALIDLNNSDLKDAGTHTLDSVPLVAYDENGKKLSNIEIVPSKISATITLDSFSVEVPIKVITKGKYTVGYSIASMVSSVSKVKVYGDKDIINNITYIPVEIDVTALTSNKTFNITISKPSGVRYISETNVTIDVTMGTETSKEISGIGLETINLAQNLTANAANVSGTNVTVILKGIDSVIKNIEASNIKAYLDLSKYTEPGEYDVPVVVEGDDARVQYISKTSTIKIRLSAK